jgi:hypothetical protein
MDWITASVEVIGVIIFVVWLIVPIKEFREIYHRMRHRPAVSDEGKPQQ